MTPQPELWRTKNTLFKMLVIDVSHLKLFHLLRFTGNQLKLCLVVAPSDASHIHIKYGMVHLARYALRARQHRGVVMQEVHPMVNIMPIGFLVRDIANNYRLVCLTEFQNLAQRVLHRDADGS